MNKIILNFEKKRKNDNNYLLWTIALQFVSLILFSKAKIHVRFISLFQIFIIR